jgi:hypothetical protein
MINFIIIAVVLIIAYIILGSLTKAASKDTPVIPDIKPNEDNKDNKDKNNYL